MGEMFYAEINLFCILVILVEIFRMNIWRETYKNAKLAILSFLFFTIAFSFDFIWLFMAGEIINVVFATIVIHLYFIFLMMGIIFWFFYCENVNQTKLSKNKVYLFLACLPAIIVEVLAMCGLMFHVTENGVYHHEVLYVLQPVVAFFYIIHSAVIPFMLSFYGKNKVKKTNNWTMFIFSAVPSVLVIVQLLCKLNISLLAIGITLSIIMFGYNSQKQLITTDTLTELNNRKRLKIFLNRQIAKNPKRLWLIIIDLDKFKQINDNYGHNEGDIALIQTAEVLRNSAPSNFTVCRYGGDEFIVTGCADSIEEIKEIIEKIEDKNDEYNLKNEKKWNVCFSFGYTKYKEKQSISEFIGEADKHLYKNKKEKTMKK